MLFQQVGHAAEFDIHTHGLPVDLAKFGRGLLRALAVLKVRVNDHGLGPAWLPTLNPAPFDPDVWLSPRPR